MNIAHITCLSVLVLGMTLPAQAAESSLMQPLTNQGLVKGCSWAAESKQLGKGYMLLAEFDESAVYMRIDGADTRLRRDPVTSLGKRYAVGDTIQRTYRADGVVVNAAYRVTSMCPANEESCEVTQYDATFVAEKDGRKQTISAQASHGC